MTFHNLIFFEEYEILIVKCHKLQNLWQSIKQTMFYFENEMFHCMICNNKLYKRKSSRQQE